MEFNESIDNRAPLKMYNDITIEDKVIRIISHHSGWKTTNIFRASRIESDLRIIGGDILIIIQEIERNLNTDFSTMEFGQYFHQRGESFMARFFKIKRERHRKAFPVTVDHLITVVENGSWFSPPQARLF
ncbi:MAG: hypothetical protein ACI8VC_000294 [Candidatus Endobugula sp.]|jgi:hypothetical protein